MKTPLTQAAAIGHRNSSLLGAFALMLAFAFSVSSTAAPAYAAGQHLLPTDACQPLVADVDAPLDIAIPIALNPFATILARTLAPQIALATEITALAPAVFLARAPPAANS